MSEQSVANRRLTLVSITEAVIIALMLGLIIYLMQFIRAGAVVTLTSPNPTAQATTLPDATSTPNIDTLAPSSQNTKLLPKYQSI